MDNKLLSCILVLISLEESLGFGSSHVNSDCRLRPMDLLDPKLAAPVEIKWIKWPQNHFQHAVFKHVFARSSMSPLRNSIKQLHQLCIFKRSDVWRTCADFGMAHCTYVLYLNSATRNAWIILDRFLQPALLVFPSTWFAGSRSYPSVPCGDSSRIEISEIFLSHSYLILPDWRPSGCHPSLRGESAEVTMPLHSCFPGWTMFLWGFNSIFITDKHPLG